MKLKLFFAAIFAAFFIAVLAIAVLAQEEPPPPYAGLKNPFPWDNASAQEAGKKSYQKLCLSCHGVKGDSLPDFNFSATDFSQKLEDRADYYFWILSEGRLERGMPPYRSALSEELRWQVLTYLWALGKPAPPTVTPPPKPLEEVGALVLKVPEQAQAGQPITLRAILQDKQGKPIENGTVKFFLKVGFFARGLMELGEAKTDSSGIAVLEYTPRLEGKLEVVARSDNVEAATPLTLTETDKRFYQTRIGIKLPTFGKEIFVGPESARELGEMGQAPTSAFRLSGGTFSWILLPVIALIIVWATYFRVMRQLLRIPVVGRREEANLRLVPLIGMVAITALGVLLVLMIVTGPYSQFHLLP